MLYNIYGGYVDNHHAPNAPRLRVMTFNAGGWYCGTGRNIPSAEYAGYLALHKGMIERNAPDILAINEYWDVMSDNGALAQDMLSQYFPYIHSENGRDTYMGRCICSKYPITNYVPRNYSKRSGGTSNFYYDTCLVTLDNGMSVNLLTTHMDPNNGIAERDVEIAELIAHMETLSGKIILCGDHNPYIDSTDKSDEKYIHAALPFIEQGYNLANWGDFGFMITWSYKPEYDQEDCLDNIITSPGIQIERAYVDTTKRTDELTGRIDHMPLIADIQFLDEVLLEPMDATVSDGV